MYSARLLSPVLVFALLFSACKTAPEEDTDIVVTLDPEFTVDLYEERDVADGHATFGLWVESAANYSCAGYQIKANTLSTPGAVTVHLLDAIQPDPCIGAPSPASAFIPIGNLPDGNYELTFTLGQAIENRGALKIENGLFEWTLNKPAGIDLQNRVLRHLPEGLVWGYVRTLSEAEKPLALAFLSDLKTISEADGLEPGYYGYFTITGVGTPFFHKSFTPEGSAVYFVRRLNGNPDELRGLLDAYRNAAQQPVDIVCRSTWGEI